MHPTERGEKETDNTFLVIVNASHLDVTQKLPAGQPGVRWETLIDTAREESEDDGDRLLRARRSG
jgi:glycogen operon protein